MREPTAIRDLQHRIAVYEDMQAYRELYDLLSDGLFRFTFSMIKSREASEEIVSDVFIKLWQIRDKLLDIDNLRVYLYTIAKNFSFNYITRNYKNPVVSMDGIDVDMMAAIPPFRDAEDNLSDELLEHVRAAISKLPPQCRLIFQLVKEEELKYKEVAAILDISPLTVRNQLAIAIKKINESLPAPVRASLKFSMKFSHS